MPRTAQVRTLLEHVDSLCLRQQKASGRRAAAVICGDFNSAAGGPRAEWAASAVGQLATKAALLAVHLH